MLQSIHPLTCCVIIFCTKCKHRVSSHSSQKLQHRNSNKMNNITMNKNKIKPSFSFVPLSLSNYKKPTQKKNKRKSWKVEKFKYLDIGNFMRLQEKSSNLHEIPKTYESWYLFFKIKDLVCFNGIHLLEIAPTYLAFLLSMIQQCQNSWIVFSPTGVTNIPWCSTFVIVDLISDDMPVTLLGCLLRKMIQLSRSFKVQITSVLVELFKVLNSLCFFSLSSQKLILTLLLGRRRQGKTKKKREV